MRVCIAWNQMPMRTHDIICERLGLPRGMTVNRETYAEVDEDVLAELRNLEEKKFVELRNKTV